MASDFYTNQTQFLCLLPEYHFPALLCSEASVFGWTVCMHVNTVCALCVCLSLLVCVQQQNSPSGLIGACVCVREQRNSEVRAVSKPSM